LHARPFVLTTDNACIRKGTNCSRVLAALGQPVNRQLADLSLSLPLSRRCKLTPDGRIGNRKKKEKKKKNTKLSRGEGRWADAPRSGCDAAKKFLSVFRSTRGGNYRSSTRTRSLVLRFSSARRTSRRSRISRADFRSYAFPSSPERDTFFPSPPRSSVNVPFEVANRRRAPKSRNYL